MKKVLFLITLFAVFFAMGTVEASSHQHHPKQHALSPFTGKSEIPHHCILHGHSLKRPCPHLSGAFKNRDSFLLSVDCGGSPIKNNPTSGGVKKQEVFQVSRDLIIPSGSFILFTSNFGFTSFITFPIYHPPRFI